MGKNNGRQFKRIEIHCTDTYLFLFSFSEDYKFQRHVWIKKIHVFTERDVVDLVDGTGMQQEPVGVSVTENRCHSNDTIAYEIAESALLTISTNTLFPNGIPHDFSILVVARPKIG